MRRSTILFTLMMGLLLVLVSAALWWRVDSEIRHFSSYQQQLMNRQATLSVSRINRLVSSLRNRMIAVSLDARWLQDLEHYGSINAMQRSLSERFRLYFPEMNAFTISNAQGEQLWGDLDFLDSESCRADLENTAAMLTHKASYFEYQPRIHDKPGNHHFDMMFPVFWNQQKLVLFMSFKAQLLSQVLQENRISDHFTYLLRKDRPGLIEVSPQGDRENLVRDFFLQPGELQRVTAQEPVPYTRWEVAVIENPAVGSRFKATIYRDAWIAWGLFMVLWGSLLWLALK